MIDDTLIPSSSFDQLSLWYRLLVRYSRSEIRVGVGGPVCEVAAL